MLTISTPVRLRGGGGNTPVLIIAAALTACSTAAIDPNEPPPLDAWQICGDLCDSDFWSGATAADVRREPVAAGGAVTQLTNDRSRSTPLHFVATAGGCLNATDAWSQTALHDAVDRNEGACQLTASVEH